MQIPSQNSDPFIRSMSEKAENIRELFLERVRELTKKAPLKVMLGDGTVTDQESFDPLLTRQFFESLLRKLPRWSNDGVAATSDQDLRRSFIKFETREGNYLLSGHMSLQYHALLFYKLDHQVIEIQKELAELTDRINILQAQVGPENDKIIEERLRQRGFQKPNNQELFEVLFKDDDLVEELAHSLQSSHKEITDLTSRRDQLFRDLDNLLIEVYHTTPVLIDEMRMIAAEEGCLCNFDLEYIKNNAKEGNVNITRISGLTKTNLLVLLDNIITILKK